jgi:hypothetical protein
VAIFNLSGVANDIRPEDTSLTESILDMFEQKGVNVQSPMANSNPTINAGTLLMIKNTSDFVRENP